MTYFLCFFSLKIAKRYERGDRKHEIYSVRPNLDSLPKNCTGFHPDIDGEYTMKHWFYKAHLIIYCVSILYPTTSIQISSAMTYQRWLDRWNKTMKLNRVMTRCTAVSFWHYKDFICNLFNLLIWINRYKPFIMA